MTNELHTQVFNRDCIELMRTLPDNYFHLAVADPPYGMAGVEDSEGARFGARFAKYNVGQTDMNTWDAAPADDFFTELFRVSEHQVIWGANFFPQMPACKCFLCWVKTNIPDGFQMAQAEYAWTSLTCNARVFHYSSSRPRDNADHFHPTEKPTALYRWLYDVWLESTALKPTDGPLRVFDPMMGSQSSRIAAHALGLDYTGCELDAEYFRRGCLRFEQETAGTITRPDGSQITQLSLF